LVRPTRARGDVGVGSAIVDGLRVVATLERFK
jgi:hypothetical protein